MVIENSTYQLSLISFQLSLKPMLYMVVEHFKNGDAKPIYKRFQAKGRLAPDGLEYISSWVDEDLRVCFQLMETSDKRLLEEWIEHWKDLVDFDVFPVKTSAEATKEINKKYF